nr:hypothetical protein [Tanacetum cinerariifolium]
LEDITYSDDEEDVGAEADFINLETNITVSPIPTTRVHKDHYVTQITGDLSSATKQGEELLQFKMQKVWVLVDLPNEKRAIEFEDFSDNNINEVNAVDTLVAVGQISSNNTNTFSAAGPSNNDVSLTLEKSSYVDTS